MAEAVAIWQAMEKISPPGKKVSNFDIISKKRRQRASKVLVSNFDTKRRDRASKFLGMSTDTLSKAK